MRIEWSYKKYIGWVSIRYFFSPSFNDQIYVFKFVLHLKIYSVDQQNKTISKIVMVIKSGCLLIQSPRLH